MGLLTDPSGGQGKLTQLLLKYYVKLYVLFYIGGIIWFCVLAHPSMNASTYFSENALLPGLVKVQFYEKSAMQYYEELQHEEKKYDNSIPYPWILAKFQQLGLDTYVHNFTLNSPLRPSEKYNGKNVYGILRAARAASTEALVLSVPYRPPTSAHPSTTASIAIMMSFAQYAIKGQYWAKDIIFLITEHEQLGIQAWLEAYHGVTCGADGILNHGDLRGRAGAIQAAINLELHAPKIAHMDIKIEGLNGQLPNLDLFNVACKMCMKEGVYYTFKNRPSEFYRDPIKQWTHYFKNLLAMVLTQTTGIPNGNHGLFLRFGIQALTIEGFENSKIRGTSKIGFSNIGRILEGTFRSMNNLLERFHQSFFFYLLPSSDRYISISLYMPCVCLIAGALFIKACAKWCQLVNKPQNESGSKEKETPATQKSSNVNYVKIIATFAIIHGFGILTTILPQCMANFSTNYNISNPTICVYHSILMMCGISLIIPFVTPRMGKDGIELFNVFSLLELGTALVCIAMINFSLGMFCAAIVTPMALMINSTPSRLYSHIQKLLWILLHPLLIVFTVVLINTYIMFPEEPSKDMFKRTFDATQQAILYSVADMMIYGNWLYSVVMTIFVPNWICLFCVTFRHSEIESKPKNVPVQKKND